MSTLTVQVGIDEKGNRYGRLLVLSCAGKGKWGALLWLCHCDCGNEKVVSGASLRSGNTRSCGCLRRERVSSATIVDRVGHRYGRLTVLERAGSDRLGAATWLCKCDCGSEIVVRSGSLQSGNTKSCGCLQRESRKKVNALPEGVSAFNYLLDRMKRGAGAKGYEWRLTKEQVCHLTKRPCYYCGAKPSRVCKTTADNGRYIYNGLDRIDNTKGYIIDNVVPCCATCNYAKRSMTVKEFKSWANRLYEHFVRRVDEK